ncbi:MAG TPA: hypothetical protein VJ952_03100 [Opitutales bacterium]|nr:hypothetical protein [Opitutales bacterium]
MPAKLIWGRDHYVIKYSGAVSVDESVSVYGELVGSPNFDDSRYGILDCRKIESVEYSEMDYKRHAAIAMSAAKIKEELRIALVIPNETIEKSIRPFLESVSEKFQHKWERQIFRKYDEAVVWAASENPRAGGTIRVSPPPNPPIPSAPPSSTQGAP